MTPEDQRLPDDRLYRATLVVQYAQGWIGSYRLHGVKTLNEWSERGRQVDDALAHGETGCITMRCSAQVTPMPPTGDVQRPVRVLINLRHVAMLRFDIDFHPEAQS